MAEVVRGFNRVGFTLKSLEHFLLFFPDTESTLGWREFVSGQVLDWGYGKPTEEVLRNLYLRYWGRVYSVEQPTRDSLANLMSFSIGSFILEANPHPDVLASVSSEASVEAYNNKLKEK